MQNRHIRKLAKKLRSTYRKNKPRSWRRTSILCKVFTEDGRVNPGLAKRIASEKEYQPTDDVISRLIEHGAIEIVKRQRKAKTISDLTESELIHAIEHRELPVILGWLHKARIGQ